MAEGPPATRRPLSTIEGLNRILIALVGVSDKVSDIIFSPGKPAQIELNSQLRGVKIPGLEVLTAEDTADLARVLTEHNPAAVEALEQNGSADLSHAVADKCRFRVNVFRQRGAFAAVLRVIASAIPTFDQLRLPPSLKQIAELKNGIVLITGPTGSGKSSTLAAIIDLINETRSDHVVTIEDPIEFLHKHKKSTIHQRELHSDTPSFGLALRAALRQAPKVILVGEMRDKETIETAFEASETGHLVLSTLHTIDASRTVDRIIGVFPKSEEPIVRTRLASTFRFIVSQRLLPRADGKGRVVSLEIMVPRPGIRNLSRDDKVHQIYGSMQTGQEKLGMQTANQSLASLYMKHLISLEAAMNASSMKDELQDMINRGVGVVAGAGLGRSTGTAAAPPPRTPVRS
jgi:twitching motility protein PilT